MTPWQRFEQAQDLLELEIQRPSPQPAVHFGLMAAYAKNALEYYLVALIADEGATVPHG